MSIIPRSVFDPLSLDVWDPFAAFSSAAASSFRPSDALMGGAQMDWKETPEAHVFKADLPGMNKQEVKIEVEDGRLLQISGERKHEKEENNDNERWHRLERSYGSFTRRFRLPDNANTDEIKATMENGVLTVTVPKIPEPKADIKHIQISG